MAAMEQFQAILDGVTQQNQNMMRQLAEQQHAAMVELVKNMKGGSGITTDTCGIGKPISFNGEKHKWQT